MNTILFPLLFLFPLALFADILVQAESFQETGGWVVDPQFMDQMGSPYLLAHGMGKPVLDAVTTVVVPSAGKYRVWVRTMDWTARWKVAGSPGKFLVSLAGKALPVTFGTTGEEWGWQDGGIVELAGGSLEVRLHDLTGFEGRCDAILLSKDLVVVPDPKLSSLGNRQVQDAGSYDLVVVGGGIAGISAAVQAARQGLSVALIQNRPVLGGNNSSEIRVPIVGKTRHGPFPELGKVVEELDKGGDLHKALVVEAEKNIRLFLEHHMNAVEAKDGKVISVTAEHVRTGERRKFSGTFFADCTGDGTLGFLAGADYRKGREGRDETGESKAPEKADKVFLGATLHWNSANGKTASSFPDCPWALEFNAQNCMNASSSAWDWESGYRYDMIDDAEYIRDYLFRVIYGNWSYQKKNLDKFQNSNLTWMAYVLGKRESRRLMGDVVVNQADVLENRAFPDGCVFSAWGIDLHGPHPENTKYFPGEEFIAKADHAGKRKQPFVIPYRSFYSRNIGNLFMAGRCISDTHVALGQIRVQKTTGTMGEVVGLAAAVCKDKGCLPKDVFPGYWKDLARLFNL